MAFPTRMTEDESSSAKNEASMSTHADLLKKLQDMKVVLGVKEERLREMTAELALLRRESDRAKKMAKFDLMAREGQTRKVAILEHTVSTLRHNLRSSLEHRQSAETKLAALERSWQMERSLRLQDLHRHDTICSDAAHAKRTVVEMESKWLAAEKRVQALESEVKKRSRELESQCRVSEGQEDDVRARVAETFACRSEVLGLKRTLVAREDEIKLERTNVANLRAELSRVRRDYMSSTTNRNEQQEALLGGRRKGATRQRRARNATEGSLTCPSGGEKIEPTSQLSTSIFQDPRKGVSCDGIFVVDVDPRPATSMRWCQGAATVQTTSRQYSATSRQSGNSRTLARSSDRIRETGADWGPTLRRQSAQKPDAVCRNSSGSSLSVPGSLYVGQGLGVRKAPCWVPSGGSAKDALKNILDLQFRDEHAPPKSDSHDEEYKRSTHLHRS